MAAELGYTTGEFRSAMLAQNGKLLMGWLEYYQKQLVPPELNCDWKEFRKTFLHEAGRQMAEELKEYDYHHPKKKAVEVELSGSDGGPIDHSFQIEFVNGGEG